jgi:hypothetical protein
VVLATDEQREVRRQECQTCGREYEQVTAFVYRDGDAYSIYHAQCHSHGDNTEVWLDIVVGSWAEPDFPDHASFSCRVGEAGAGVVDALAVVEGRAPHFGQKLSRAEALAHERLPDVWELVDWIVVTDPTVSRYMHAAGH